MPELQIPNEEQKEIGVHQVFMNAETWQVSYTSEMANKLGWKGQHTMMVTLQQLLLLESKAASTCEINIYLFC